MEESIGASPPKERNIKWLVLTILGPALIAGFFAIVPTIYTEWVKPRAVLSYSIISGPSIPTPEGFRRIFGATIVNSGKASLNDVEVNVDSESGKVQNIVEEKNLLHSTLMPTSILVPKMLTGEQIKFSVMTISNLADSGITIVARSNEVLGTQTDLKDSRPIKIYIDLIGAVLSALSVAIMSTAMLFRFRSGKDLRSILFLKNKPDMITYIAGLSGVLPMTYSVWMSEHNMSYARLADLFLFSGLSNTQSEKSRCINSLECILFVKNVSSTSIEKIRLNLSLLGKEYSDFEFNIVRDNAIDIDDISLRKKIARKLLQN